MAPVYRTHVRQQFDRCTYWAREAGLDTTQWQLIEASGPVGWKLQIPGEAGKVLPGLGQDWLGSTAREAESALRYMTAAFRIMVASAVQAVAAMESLQVTNSPTSSQEPT